MRELDVRGAEVLERPVYEPGLVCENGHTVNGLTESRTELNANFCPDCGAATLKSCRSCGNSIRGGWTDEVLLNSSDYFERPAYCTNCGQAFPWTDAALSAARELAQQLDLSPAERADFDKSLDHIVHDDPQTPLAASRMKKLFARAGKETADLLRKVLTDVASETAKKILFP